MIYLEKERKYGIINIFNANLLHQKPRLYTAFMVYFNKWIIWKFAGGWSPEIPKLLFFFDEAHILFQYGSKILIEKLTQVIRLIRSKGVGVFFITTSWWYTEDILSQLGNKIQHALRAFTPKDRRMIRQLQKFQRKSNLTVEALTNLESDCCIMFSSWWRWYADNYRACIDCTTAIFTWGDWWWCCTCIMRVRWIKIQKNDW